MIGHAVATRSLGVVLELPRSLGHRLDAEALQHLERAPLPGALGRELGMSPITRSGARTFARRNCSRIPGPRSFSESKRVGGIRSPSE